MLVSQRQKLHAFYTSRKQTQEGTAPDGPKSRMAPVIELDRHTQKKQKKRY